MSPSNSIPCAFLRDSLRVRTSTIRDMTLSRIVVSSVSIVQKLYRFTNSKNNEHKSSKAQPLYKMACDCKRGEEGKSIFIQRAFSTAGEQLELKICRTLALASSSS